MIPLVDTPLPQNGESAESLDVDLYQPPQTCENTKSTPYTFQLSFDEVQPGCEWNTDGNLSPAEGQLTARITQTQDVDIASFTAICSLSLDFDPHKSGQSIYYDDELFLMINGIVLLASDTTQVQTLETDGYFYRYDWSVLAGTPIDFSPSVPPYCLGEAEGWSQCTVPDADVEGEVVLELEESLMRVLGDIAIADGALVFDMVTAGDNDEGRDCSHSYWTFEVKIDAI